MRTFGVDIVAQLWTRFMESSYTMDFGDGLKCTADIDLETLKNGKGRIQFITMTVEGQLIPGIIPRYREWMLMIHQDAANYIDGKVIWFFQISPEMKQAWEIIPHKGWQQIDMAKVIPPKKGKPDCKKCHGRGYVGRNFVTKQLIACPCTETSERKILIRQNIVRGQFRRR